MLRPFSKKLCPLLSLAIAAMGCGKKITDNSSPDGNHTSLETQNLPSTVVIRLDGDQSITKIYSIPRNANVFLPETLKVRQGSGIGKIVVITYNLSENAASDFDFKCTYSSTTHATELPLSGCQDRFGGPFSDVQVEFPIYYGKIIKMELQGMAAGIAIDAIYTADWK